MSDFVSKVKTIPHNDADVFNVLSDLNNLEKVRDKVPEDKIKEFTFDKDSCTIAVEPIGKVKFVVIEREPNKTIKFQSEQIPFDVLMWIQLKAGGEKETKLKLTVRADLNVFIKPMVSKPLQQGVDKIAEMLEALPYDEMLNSSTIAE